MNKRTKQKLATLKMIRALLYQELDAPTELIYDIASENGIDPGDVTKGMETYMSRVEWEITGIEGRSEQTPVE